MSNNIKAREKQIELMQEIEQTIRESNSPKAHSIAKTVFMIVASVCLLSIINNPFLLTPLIAIFLTVIIYDHLYAPKIFSRNAKAILKKYENIAGQNTHEPLKNLYTKNNILPKDMYEWHNAESEYIGGIPMSSDARKHAIRQVEFLLNQHKPGHMQKEFFFAILAFFLSSATIFGLLSQHLSTIPFFIVSNTVGIIAFAATVKLYKPKTFTQEVTELLKGYQPLAKSRFDWLMDNGYVDHEFSWLHVKAWYDDEMRTFIDPKGYENGK